LVERCCADGRATGPFRLFLHASDGHEPRHVERESNIAKFWLGPVRLLDSGGVRGSELQ